MYTAKSNKIISFHLQINITCHKSTTSTILKIINGIPPETQQKKNNQINISWKQGAHFMYFIQYTQTNAPQRY